MNQNLKILKAKWTIRGSSFWLKLILIKIKLKKHKKEEAKNELWVEKIVKVHNDAVDTYRHYCLRKYRYKVLHGILCD